MSSEGSDLSKWKHVLICCQRAFQSGLSTREDGWFCDGWTHAEHLHHAAGCLWAQQTLKKTEDVTMNQTHIDGQEDKPQDWGTSVGAVQDQTSRTKVVNILTDSRACRWWSGTHEGSEILCVLLGAIFRCPRLELFVPAPISEDILEAHFRFTIKMFQMWETIWFERVPILVVL